MSDDGTSVVVRDARADDYASVAAWFLEMKTGDSAPSRQRWEERLRPRTRIAELGGVPVGYVLLETWPSQGYVRNVVSDPSARGRGVGRALLRDAQTRFREAGCDRWRLNVKPDNTPAVELYRSVGMSVSHEAASLRFTWSTVDQLPPSATPSEQTLDVVRPTAATAAEAEVLFDLAPGQVAGLARHNGLVVRVGVDKDGQVVSVASFDPDFPGCFPFQVGAVWQASAMLRSLRGFAVPGKAEMGLVAEDDEALVDLLVRAGARVALRFVHMSGRLLA